MANILKGVSKQYVGTTAQLVDKTITNLDSLNITDFPENAITNQQMTDAISTYFMFFKVGEIYTCSDDGTYTKGVQYQFTLTDTVYSWEAVSTPGLQPDNVTIILNEEGKLEVVGITDNSTTTSSVQIQNAISINRAGVKSVSNGQLELTMAQFESLATVDTDTEYDITDHPSDSITNTQMTFALTCSRLFPAGATYICQDNGTYSAAHIYQIVVNGGVKSWLDMTSSLGYAVRSFI